MRALPRRCTVMFRVSPVRVLPHALRHPSQVLPSRMHAPDRVDPGGSEAGSGAPAWQQQLMEVMAQESREKRQRAMKAIKACAAQRAASYDIMRCLDHALKLAGSGLAHFAPQDAAVAPSPLRATEYRFRVRHDDWPFELPEGVVGYKAVIKDRETEERRFELPLFAGPRPCLALVMDQGAHCDRRCLGESVSFRSTHVRKSGRSPEFALQALLESRRSLVSAFQALLTPGQTAEFASPALLTPG